MNVRNIEPFPDVRDSVTGEWLPMNYNMAQAQEQASIDEAQTRAQSKKMASMLLSVIK